MNKKIILFSLFFLLFAIFFFVSQSEKEIEKVCIKENCFSVEIADENNERILGLSNRDFLDLDSGMLFVFPDKTIPNFWMKEMNFPIDIIWIDENLEIVDISKNLQPCAGNFCETYNPDRKIKYVLEINSGLSESFEIGDKAIFVRA